jgi:hypothetical protein
MSPPWLTAREAGLSWSAGGCHAIRVTFGRASRMARFSVSLASAVADDPTSIRTNASLALGT